MAYAVNYVEHVGSFIEHDGNSFDHVRMTCFDSLSIVTNLEHVVNVIELVLNNRYISLNLDF